MEFFVFDVKGPRRIPWKVLKHGNLRVQGQSVTPDILSQVCTGVKFVGRTQVSGEAIDIFLCLDVMPTLSFPHGEIVLEKLGTSLKVQEHV